MTCHAGRTYIDVMLSDGTKQSYEYVGPWPAGVYAAVPGSLLYGPPSSIAPTHDKPTA
ncbi:MAG TPA: hypothetical protein VLR26_05130 [Frankiaceae bacterium]|nr:hypothetical protein [Frankiaceae bacterium]